MVLLTSCFFDWNFRVLWGLLFGLQTGFYNILMAFRFVLIVVLVWRKGYVQNHCPLVANFGTRACGFAGGSDFASVSHSVGGILCLYFLL